MRSAQPYGPVNVGGGSGHAHLLWESYGTIHNTTTPSAPQPPFHPPFQLSDPEPPISGQRERLRRQFRVEKE